jgi:hypothetical protein
MSLSSTTNRNDYVGTNATAVYPYTFKIFRKQDVRVVKKNLSLVEFVLVVDIDYTVSGVNAPGGGNITLLAGNLPTGYKLTLRRVVEHKQETDVRNQGDYFAEVHEDQFDRHVMAAQQLADDVARSVRNPETVSSTEFSPILPADITTPNSSIIVNPTGTGFVTGIAGVGGDRIFKSATYAALKALALAEPTLQRAGWATDIQQEVFYTADIAVGDSGWIIRG